MTEHTGTEQWRCAACGHTESVPDDLVAFHCPKCGRVTGGPGCDEKAKPKEETCGTCAFYDKETTHTEKSYVPGGDDYKITEGECHHGPPSVLTWEKNGLSNIETNPNERVFPPVGPRDWCGQWKAREE